MAAATQGKSETQEGYPMLKYHCSTKDKRLVRVNGRIIGKIEDGIFTKSVIGSKHMLRCPPAWAIQGDAFENEVKTNAKEIVVIDKETNIQYRTTVEIFDSQKGTLDRGFGKQYFLTLNHWEERGNGHHQLSLWGGGEFG